jgi:hypothetical protein
MADHFSREAVTGITGTARRVHPLPVSASRHRPVKLTVPSEQFRPVIRVTAP